MRTTDKIDLVEASEDIRRRELADRFAAIGVIAGGIAHDLGNPLNVVTNALAVLTREIERGDTVRAREALAFAREATEQMETLVACVKAALYPGDGKPVDVADALRAAAKLADPEIRQRARLALDVAPGALVLADRSRLVQVFLKILINAAQAIGEGARDANEIRATAKYEGRSIVVAISDTGHGMPAYVASRVFEPFFSTKAAGKGAGLGLFVCHEIVTALGGSIGVQSAEGRGTTFRVSLPAHEPARAPMGSEPISAVIPRARRSGTVLVIDDDPEIGAALRDCIGADHRVDVSTDPHYGLARLRAGIPYDVILCDVQMPGMSGLELHARACELPGNVGSRFVFVTGAVETPRYARENGVETLHKPFRAEEIRALVAARIGVFPLGSRRA
jgi:CheY-like chemotaxis protein